MLKSAPGKAQARKVFFKQFLAEDGTETRSSGLCHKFMVEEKSHQLPSSMVQKEFGEVNVRVLPNSVEVLFTVLMEPSGQNAEGWRTGVALDASSSMICAYGKKLEGTVPREIKEEYKKKGWLVEKTEDGHDLKCMHKEAVQDAVSRKYLRYTENIMEKLARDFIGYLASGLDAQGKTSVLYWACGDGGEYEYVGDFTADECKTISIQGPKKHSFGRGTKLKPVLHYFKNSFRNARQAMGIFLTDGVLEDFEEVKTYSIELAREIESKKCNPIKYVLIGVGDEICEEQLEALDDLETGTDVDIWDHKIAREMRSLVEIFAEVVDENQIVAPTATIYDAKNRVVKRFNDGMPAKVRFEMERSSPFFELEVGETRIRQKIAVSSSTSI